MLNVVYTLLPYNYSYYISLIYNIGRTPSLANYYFMERMSLVGKGGEISHSPTMTTYHYIYYKGIEKVGNQVEV